MSIYPSKENNRLAFAEIAKAAMVGLLSDHVDMESERRAEANETCAECVARLACEHAEALLKELDK